MNKSLRFDLLLNNNLNNNSFCLLLKWLSCIMALALCKSLFEILPDFFIRKPSQDVQ